MDLTEADDIKRWQEYTEELYRKDLHDPDNHDGVITHTHLDPDILECEVKWALGSITMNKASGGDGIPVELFQLLKDGAIFDKRGRNIQWRKNNLFNKWCWENWSTTCKRMKLEHFLTPYTKINSKWIKDLNVRPETIKLLEENIGKALYDVNHSRILYDPPPRVMETKAKINK